MTDGDVVALLAVRALPAPRHSPGAKDDDRFGAHSPAVPTIGKAEDAGVASGDEEDEGDNSLPGEEITRRDQRGASSNNHESIQVDRDPAPPYEERTPTAYNERTDLDDNPIWKCVRSELDREHGESYRWLFRDENSEQPGTIKPFRMACYMGFKITTIIFLPLMNDIARFLWSLLHLVMVYTITSLSLIAIKWGIDYRCYNNSCDGPEFSSEIISLQKGTIYSLDGIAVTASLVATADVVICIAYLIRKRLWHTCCRISPEEQPLLGGGRRSRLKTVADWWDKYCDIPRFIVSEILLIAMHNCAGIVNRNGLEVAVAIIVLVQFSLLSVVELCVLMSVLYKSTCHKGSRGVNNRGTWFLWPFIVHFTLQRISTVYIMTEQTEILIINSADIKEKYINNDHGYLVTVLWLVSVQSLLIPLLAMVVFLAFSYQWVKFSLSKTFKDFLDYLYLHQQNSSQCEREHIQNVLDRFQYETLDSSQRLNDKVTSYIPNLLQLILPTALLVLYAGLLVFISYKIHSVVRHSVFVVFITVVVSSNVVIIVWLVYGLICTVKERLWK